MQASIASWLGVPVDSVQAGYKLRVALEAALFAGDVGATVTVLDGASEAARVYLLAHLKVLCRHQTQTSPEKFAAVRAVFASSTFRNRYGAACDKIQAC